MKNSKKAIISAFALASLIAVGTLGVRAVKAEENDPILPIAARIAQTFGLQEDDVEAVFNAVRDERETEMNKGREEKLSQAVNDGVITQEQKNAILNKWEEMRSERDQKRVEHRQEMQNWFEENGIDHEALMQYQGLGGHGGPGMGKGYGMR